MASKVFQTPRFNRRLCGKVGAHWRSFVVLLAPVLYLPLILRFDNSKEANCGYAVLIMATYWITEAIPLPITALMPFILFPMLGVMGSKEVASTYVSDTSIVLLGSLIVALAIEKCRLHVRLSLRVLMFCGSKPVGALAGFMLPTWLMTMWICNTAACGMVLPAAERFLELMEMNQRRGRQVTLTSYVQRENNPPSELMGEGCRGLIRSFSGNDTLSTNDEGQLVAPTRISINNQQQSSDAVEESTCSDVMAVNTSETIQGDDEELKRIKWFGKILTLSICYSANIGGTATLVGTPTNLLVAEVANKLFEERGLEPPITYGTWIAFGVPHAIICILLAYVWLLVVYWGFSVFISRGRPKRRQNNTLLDTLLRKEYEKLGPLSFAEIEVSILFIVMVVLWLTRNPGFTLGYASLFKHGFVTDSFPPILVSVLLFVLPSQCPAPKWICSQPCSSNGQKEDKVSALLDWEYVSSKLPWGPLLIIGSGYALAQAFEESGLTLLIGNLLSEFSSLSPWLVLVVVCLVISMLTEVMSNLAVVNIVLPIIVGMSETEGINPLYLMLPAGIAASYAFMLPVATPPNAIAFSYGRLRTIEMASIGAVMNILCVVVVSVGIHTWGWAIFKLHENPLEANGTSLMTAMDTFTFTSAHT